MATVYITGDRSLHPVVSVNVVAAVLKHAVATVPDGETLSVVTGDSPTGIESALGYLLKGDPNFTVYPRTQNAEGQWDFDAHNKSLASSVDKVYLLHSDPFNSKVAKSVLQNFPQEKVLMPFQEEI